MTLIAVCNVAADWRMRIVSRKSWPLFGATRDHAQRQVAGRSFAQT